LFIDHDFLIKSSDVGASDPDFWGMRLEAAVTASSLAFVGYDDFHDSFSLLALTPLSAGETIYFTNNGWSSTQGKFNGADASQGAGNESLIKLTLTQNVAKGTVIYSGADAAAWQWTKSGVIPGQIGGAALFSDLAIDYESDQIYAFQGSASNPLLNPTSFIYALHFGSIDYPFFSDSEDSLTGDIPPGLSLGAKNAFAHTNLTFHGDADGNHSAWGLNPSAPAVAALQTSGGTKDLWLAVIADSSNWSAGQPSLSAFNVTPEPSRAVLALLGFQACLIRRKRTR
jgi:hypothetical protein